MKWIWSTNILSKPFTNKITKIVCGYIISEQPRVLIIESLVNGVFCAGADLKVTFFLFNHRTM